MAKIEITGSPEELDRITIFLTANNIKHVITEDLGKRSKLNYK